MSPKALELWLLTLKLFSVIWTVFVLYWFLHFFSSCICELRCCCCRCCNLQLRIHYAFDSVSSIFQSTADNLQSLDIKGCWVLPKLEEHHELHAPKPIEFGTLSWWDCSWTFFIELLSWTISLSRSDCFSFVQVDTVSLLQTDSSKSFFRCVKDFSPTVMRVNSLIMSLISHFCLFLMEQILICTSL